MTKGLGVSCSAGHGRVWGGGRGTRDGGVKWAEVE